jgi:hypothetical protein
MFLTITAKLVKKHDRPSAGRLLVFRGFMAGIASQF